MKKKWQKKIISEEAEQRNVKFFKYRNLYFSLKLFTFYDKIFQKKIEEWD